MGRTLKLPEGRVRRTIEGDPQALKRVLPLLRQRSFTGYLKLVSEERESTGYMILRDGKPVEVLCEGPQGTQAGKVALRPIGDLAKAADAVLEIHMDVDLEAMGPEEEAQGPLTRGLTALRRKLGNWRSPDEEAEDEAPGEDLSPAIQAWAEEGAPAATSEIRDLSNLLLEAPTDRPSPVGERTPSTGPERHGKSDREPEPKSPPESPGEAGRKARPSVDAATGLHETHTFDNLLVGDYNRFAHAAGTAIADGAVEPYSPLVIVGSPGLGKTHLLHAIGNRMRARVPKAEVLYLTASRFWSELQRADKEGRTAEFRDRFFALDLLLLDDVQDVQGRDRVQEELFELFEEYRRQGKPLVMVADRLPSAMDDVDDRLVSRLESGLVADLKVPDAATRQAYLELLVRRRRADCPKTVLRYLSERYTVDMRELEGALNKVLAYGDAMGRRVDLPLAKEALGEAATAPSVEALERPPELLPARSYLLEEERGERALQLFAQKVRNVRGLLITRTNPARLRERFGMDGADLLWLTDRADSEERTVEPSLERILHRMESFMVAGGQGILLLDGLEFLKSANSFEAVLKFLRRVVDEVAESEFTFAVTLNPGTLEEREARVLEREMEPIRLD